MTTKRMPVSVAISTIDTTTLKFSSNVDLSIDGRPIDPSAIRLILSANQTHLITGTVIDLRFDGSIGEIRGDFGGVFRGSYQSVFSNCRVDRITGHQEEDPIVLSTTDAKSTFERATSCDWSFATKFDTSQVTTMEQMFDGCSEFDEPIGNWNTSQVTNMRNMFSEAKRFNQALDNWDFARVITMSDMFSCAGRFNQPLNNWNVGRVTAMIGMFGCATSFNQPLDGWDTSSLINCSHMFFHACSFDQPLNGWKTGRIVDMSGMFLGSSFDQPLDGWDTSCVVDMSFMFANTPFNQSLENRKTNRVANMRNMFYRAKRFNQAPPANSKYFNTK
jgi:surface protein